MSWHNQQFSNEQWADLIVSVEQDLSEQLEKVKALEEKVKQEQTRYKDLKNRMLGALYGQGHLTLARPTQATKTWIVTLYDGEYHEHLHITADDVLAVSDQEIIIDGKIRVRTQTKIESVEVEK